MSDYESKRIQGSQREVAEAMVGKTIAAVDLDDDTVAIRFTDGTWCLGEWEADMDDAWVSNSWYGHIASLSAVSRIGVLTPEDVQAIHKAEAERSRAAAAEKDRAEYERLKAKFEGTSG